jgi:hypothetical protein
MELTMNQLSIEKQIMIASLLVEGNSIRSIERITGTHRDTIMRLGITLGEKAQDILDKKMKNLNCKNIQLQELLSGINVSESKVAGIISERTNFTTKEIKRLFLQGETKDAPFALKKGLVTEIRDPKIPKDTEILSFNLP